MTLCDQLGDGPLVEGPRDEEDDVVDHVAVGDVVQEGGQSARGVVPHVLELGDELLAEFVVDDGDLQRGGDRGLERDKREIQGRKWDKKKEISSTV